ncbi:MAG: hypothetical protein A2W07_00690 [candidate division Zixibacteria bacterium RBG_16_43_9]|nr:MAG: hypothetical protein A2W07_00690 [candidate division Zixibacteria bacterium RBG_16_43_9]
MKILIVDDELIIRKLFSEVLLEDGHQVHCASNGLEAVGKVKEEKYDLIFSDVHMPRMNGLEAVKIIKKMDKKVVIVMMDSFPDLMSELAQEEGAITCIHKPFELQEIRDIIKEVEAKDKRGEKIEIG